MRLADYLSRDMDVTIALMGSDAAGAAQHSAPSRIDLPVVLLSDGPAAAGFLSKSLRWLRMVCRLRALKRQHDVTISFLSGPNLLNALAGRSAATIVSERGSKRFDTGMTPFQRWLWTRYLDPVAYRGATYITAASKGLAQEIASANPRMSSRIRALEGTVLTDRLLEIADASCEPAFAGFHNRLTIAAFGRIHHQKGFDALLRVFARVRAGLPEARLLLIGDGPKYEEYMALARTLGLRAGDAIDPDNLDVIFAGYRPEPLRYLRFARVFALSSRYEGLPNALIEALASGVPILATDCPWGPRSVLADAGDVETAQDLQLPRTFKYGTLMPLLDSPEGMAAWEAYLIDILVRPPDRLPLDVRRAAVARFDIEETGKAWKSLISDVATTGYGVHKS